jgi:hypothetical protein
LTCSTSYLLYLLLDLWNTNKISISIFGKCLNPFRKWYTFISNSTADIILEICIFHELLISNKYQLLITCTCTNRTTIHDIEENHISLQLFSCVVRSFIMAVERWRSDEKLQTLFFVTRNVIYLCKLTPQVIITPNYALAFSYSAMLSCF